MTSKKFDIVSIGGATVDIFLKPKYETLIKTTDGSSEKELLCFVHGGKQQIEEVHECLGGGATNTAVGFRRLGLKSAACICIGEDEWADKILANLTKNKVAVDFVHRVRGIRSGFSVIISSISGERTVLFTPGANHTMKSECIPEELIAGTHWLFVNRISGDTDEILNSILKIKAKKNPQLKIAWNPGGNQIREGMKKYDRFLKHVEVLFLNRDEATQFTGKKSKQTSSAHKKLAMSKFKGGEFCLPCYAYDCESIFHILEKSGVNHTVITDGKCGSQVYSKGNLVFCPVINEDSVDTLGAGDSFAVGCTYALHHGHNLQNILKFGTINAMSVVHFYGAQAGLLTKRQVQEYYERYPLKTIQNKI